MLISATDHVYFVCEPPGEPYYLARIMEFLHQKNDPEAPIDAMRVNWYYRPKDILRRVQDTRVVFASMHSDTCPLTSIRGKCNIQHLSDVGNLDEYRTQQDSFWFDKLYDRYMHRYYEVIPVRKVVNVPQRVKTVLDQRWKFVLVEIGRGRELTSDSKKCTRCEQFASNHDSVDCAVCKKTYHMQCVRPPLLKKPARGFAWACAACSRAQELKLDSRNTPAGSDAAFGDDDDLMDDDEDDGGPKVEETRESSVTQETHPEPTPAQIFQANLWPWRYLGIHSRVEDALDYDDRIYPRASSRLGPRHQANVNIWHGRPVEMVKPAEIKRKYKSVHLKGSKSAKDTGTDTDKDQRQKRPKWVMDEPPGYIARGHDEPVEIKGKKENTAQLIFKMPSVSRSTERGNDDVATTDDYGKIVDEYMEKVKPIAAQYHVLDCSVDFMTKAVEKLHEKNFNIEEALQAMKHLSLKADLKQPDLNREEIKRFEEGVAKYGSELHAVARHVGGNVKESRIVRFYYMWKKTDRGRQIWGSFEGRRSKKESKRVDKEGNVTKLLDDVADDHDDSAFDDDKAVQKKRGFECKFCAARHSRQWRRAPGTPPGTLIPKDASSKNSKDKSNWLTLALCGRCAYLWRKYAVQYEDIEEISKKIASSGSRAAKRKVDEELLRLILEAHQMSGDPIPPRAVDEVNKAGLEVPANIIQPDEPPKKKAKGEKDTTAHGTPDIVPEKKKAVPEKPQEPPPLEPDPPKVKIHPCAVCHVIDVPNQQLLKCRDCRLHVHGACYGVGEKSSTGPWYCDMCRNDHVLQVSTTYECVLCPVKYTQQDLMEPVKPTHKKKTERDREKERMEREIIQEASRRWRMEQESAGRPVNPREALKRTAWNNWIHITCALWTKEIKFGNAEMLDDAEGVGFIPPDRFEPICKICEANGLPTIKCHQSNCNSFFHVGCAHQAGYQFGFDVVPVKGSRRDLVNVMRLGPETGVVTAAIWCPNHGPQGQFHDMLEPTETGLTAMQLFARTYKQVDTSVTGTVRRAAQFTFNNPITAPAVQPPQRRFSTINGVINGGPPLSDKQPGQDLRASPEAETSRLSEDGPSEPRAFEARKSNGSKKCCSCFTDVSPKWWPMSQPARHGVDSSTIANGYRTDPGLERDGPNGIRDTFMTNGVVKAEAMDTLPANAADEKRPGLYQCHKCHVLKREAPASPSQIKPREKPSKEPEPAPEPYPPYQQPAFAPPPAPPAPPAYPMSRPAHEISPAPHSHPPGPIPPHHSPWQTVPPPWPTSSSSSSVRPAAHQSPPTSGHYLHSPLYRPPPDYGQPPYSRPPPPSPYGAPPPPPPPPPAPVSLPQHSPQAPGPYGHPVQHHHAPPISSPSAPRYPSPPRFGAERPRIPSPRLNLGAPSLLSRPAYAPEPPRASTIPSPVNGYAMPHGSAPRGYGQAPPPPPPPPPMARQTSSAPTLAQITQSTEQGGHQHSRQPSAESTSRFPVRPMPLDSPNQRPITPASTAVLREEKREGTGASASPSLRNLLS